MSKHPDCPDCPGRGTCGCDISDMVKAVDMSNKVEATFHKGGMVEKPTIPDKVLRLWRTLELADVQIEGEYGYDATLNVTSVEKRWEYSIQRHDFDGGWSMSGYGWNEDRTCRFRCDYTDTEIREQYRVMAKHAVIQLPDGASDE